MQRPREVVDCYSRLNEDIACLIMFIIILCVDQNEKSLDMICDPYTKRRDFEVYHEELFID